MAAIAQNPEPSNIILPQGAEMIEDTQMMDADGREWRVFDVDDMTIALNVSTFRDHGRYFRIDAYILNLSDEHRLFNFSEASVDSDEGKIKLYSFEKYMRRVKNRNFWSGFGGTMAMFTGAVVLDAALGTALSSDNDWTLGDDLAYSLGSSLAYQAASVSSMILADKLDQEVVTIHNNNLGYFSDYNIAPNVAIEGHAFARYSPKHDRIVINLPIGNRVYSFEWKLQNIGKLL